MALIFRFTFVICLYHYHMKVLSATGLADEKGVDVCVCARAHVCVCVHGLAEKD